MYSRPEIVVCTLESALSKKPSFVRDCFLIGLHFFPSPYSFFVNLSREKSFRRLQARIKKSLLTSSENLLSGYVMTCLETFMSWRPSWHLPHPATFRIMTQDIWVMMMTSVPGSKSRWMKRIAATRSIPITSRWPKCYKGKSFDRHQPQHFYVPPISRVRANTVPVATTCIKPD